MCLPEIVAVHGIAARPVGRTVIDQSAYFRIEPVVLFGGHIASVVSDFDAKPDVVDKRVVLHCS